MMAMKLLSYAVGLLITVFGLWLIFSEIATTVHKQAEFLQKAGLSLARP